MLFFAKDGARFGGKSFGLEDHDDLGQQVIVGIEFQSFTDLWRPGYKFL
jgi:hypothetical protein